MNQQHNQTWEELNRYSLMLSSLALMSTGNTYPDRYRTYRERVMPQLQQQGYAYFLSCKASDYLEHQEWCNNHCRDHTLPHCDVWQSQDYPRAFANKEDAALFKLTFDAENLAGEQP